MFSRPSYGWDPNVVRVGIAALVRAGAVALVVGQAKKSDPQDAVLAEALRQSRQFDRVEILLEEVPLDPDALVRVRKLLMRVAKRRSIDETPAALAQVAEELALKVLADTGDVRLWAEGAKFPLSAAFADGEQAWAEVQSLTQPIHRVNKLDADAEALAAGYSTVQACRAFVDENRLAYAEQSGLVADLQLIRQHVESTSGIALFLEAWQDATNHTSFTDKEAWRRLASLRARAELELAPLVNGWRKAAQQRIDDALTRLPSELREYGLNGEVISTLSQPLVELRESIESVTQPARAASLPELAERSVRTLGERLAEELRRRVPPALIGGSDEPAPPTPRPLRRLRLHDVATLTRFATPEEWKAFHDRLDDRVRRLLDEGYDVQLD